jgi:hypothetical protein
MLVVLKQTVLSLFSVHWTDSAITAMEYRLLIMHGTLPPTANTAAIQHGIIPQGRSVIQTATLFVYLYI